MDPRRRVLDARPGTSWVQRLLLLLASVALVGSAGGVVLRPAAGPAGAAPVVGSSSVLARGGAPSFGSGAAGTERQAPAPSLEVRGLVAGVPAPLSAPDAPPPGPAGSVGPPTLVGDGTHVTREAGPDGPASAPGSRAPPLPAGTHVTLPPRP